MYMCMYRHPEVDRIRCSKETYYAPYVPHMLSTSGGLYTCVSIYTYVYMYSYLCIYIYLYIYIENIHICMCVDICIYIYIHVNIHTFVWVCVYIYIHGLGCWGPVRRISVEGLSLRVQSTQIWGI